MTAAEKYDKQITGLAAGLFLPFIIAFMLFLFAKGDPSLPDWLQKIADADIVTKVITLCVFPNVVIFLIFNHFDMLRASRGVLGITIVWAAVVFGTKFLL
jgi:hypothetical protein